MAHLTENYTYTDHIQILQGLCYTTYSKVCIGNHLPDIFPIQNGLKQEDALPSLLLNVALGYAITNIKTKQTIQKQEGSKLNGHISFWSMLIIIYWGIT
jgi:hypothetical protein